MHVKCIIDMHFTYLTFSILYLSLHSSPYSFSPSLPPSLLPFLTYLLPSSFPSSICPLLTHSLTPFSLSPSPLFPPSLPLLPPSLPPSVLEGFEIPHPDLQFKSDKTMDQRLLSQNHAPPALLEQYNQARAPPNLAEFNVEWGDDRNVMHIYSKPDFFFQCWRDEIQKQTLRKMSQMDMLSVSIYYTCIAYCTVYIYT